jgi:hypothetical protein
MDAFSPPIWKGAHVQKYTVFMLFAGGLFLLALLLLIGNLHVPNNMPVSAGILGFSIAGGLALVTAGKA